MAIETDTLRAKKAQQDRTDSEAEKVRAALRYDIKELAKSPAFKNVVWNILSMCSIYDAGYHEDTLGQYMSGKRSVGVELLDLLSSADKDFYPKLLLERRNANI
jgi:hypothetical protein